jgi:2-oxoglutarate dehydrogenase complex dehydrogenase (E1) component-like enzyme
MKDGVNLENIQFLEDLYREWEADPSRVSEEWRIFFTEINNSVETVTPLSPKASAGGAAEAYTYKQGRKLSLRY